MNQFVVGSISGVIGVVISFLFGIWPEALTFLLVAMGIDYFTGVAAAVKEKKLNSDVGFWGLARKGLTLLVIILAHRIDILLDIGDMTKLGAIFFYIANELISITENCGRVGLPLPRQIRKIIEILKDKNQE